MSHNYIEFGNGRRDFFLISHDVCLPCWEMSTWSDILFIVANGTQICKESDSTV